MEMQVLSGESVLAVRYDGGEMSGGASASARFRLRVLELMQQRGITQKQLAGSNTEGWISNKIHGRRGIQLDEAEDIASALQQPLSELIRRSDDQHYALDNLESRIIEAFRQLSLEEQRALVTLVTLRQRPAPFGNGRKVARVRTANDSEGATHGVRASVSAAALTPELQHIVARFAEEIYTHTHGQAASPRIARADRIDHRRKTRGPAP